MTDSDACQIPDITPDQRHALRIVLGVILFCQLLLLLGIFFNICFYLIPLRVNNSLISLFYAVSLIVTACYSTSAIYFILDPLKMFYCYN